MPYRLVHAEPTPNPNALKLRLDPAPGRIVSCFNAEAAKGDPIANALFGVPGVTNVLVHTEFVSVCKSPDAKWKALKAGIERALANVPH